MSIDPVSLYIGIHTLGGVVMIFSSLFFLVVFLPLLLVFYILLPNKCRNVVLLIASLIFYAFGEPRYVLIMLSSILFNYIMGLLIDKGKARKLLLVITVAGNIGVLSLFKYTDFIIGNLNNIPGVSIPLLGLALPIGISFYTFQTMSYVIDVYREKVACQKNIIRFALYVTMFPQLIAGPIVRYADIETELSDRSLHLNDVHFGAERFIVGLAKKVLLANEFGKIYDSIVNAGQMDFLSAFLAAVAFTLQIYFDFSGYSDMAIGLGRIFGFHFMENFKYPYEAKSITEFWSRWHISLSTWFKEYVYIPLGGNRKGMSRQIINLFVVWALTGIWHGAGFNFLLWGLYYFLILVLEKFVLLKYMDKWPNVCKHIYSIVIFIFGWVIFASDKVEVFTSFMNGFFNPATGAVSNNGLYMLSTHFIIILIGIIGSTRLPIRLYEKLFKIEDGKIEEGRSVGAVIFADVFLILIFLLCVATLVGDSYNPFLYFRF